MNENEILNKCDWCGAPGAGHQGGGILPDGTEISGFFCDLDHFKKWARWKSIFIPAIPKIISGTHENKLPSDMKEIGDEI